MGVAKIASRQLTLFDDKEIMLACATVLDELLKLIFERKILFSQRFPSH